MVGRFRVENTSVESKEKNKVNSIRKDGRKAAIAGQSRQTKMAGIGCDEDRCATRRARARVTFLLSLPGTYYYNVTLTKNMKDKEKTVRFVLFLS